MTEFDILLVDDEERFLETTCRLLTKRGYSAMTASGGGEAMELLDLYAFKVAILDVRMPGFDGMHVLKTIKQEYPSMEVIMLTGHATVSCAVDGLKSGAADYITKPVSIGELQQKIDQAIEKQTLIRQKISMTESS